MITTTTVRATNGRRRFLRDLSLSGDAALLGPGRLFGPASGGAQEAGDPPSAPAVQTDRKTEGGRGSSMRVSAEITDYRDEETGARVRRLTGDGSDNVHLYFTSESFLAGPANRLVFASNRSGRFQFHLLDSEAAKLVQVTDGEDLSPVMACLDPAGRLFYFDGPSLRAVALDTLEDRELYRPVRGDRSAAGAYGEPVLVCSARWSGGLADRIAYLGQFPGAGHRGPNARLRLRSLSGFSPAARSQLHPTVVLGTGPVDAVCGQGGTGSIQAEPLPANRAG